MASFKCKDMGMSCGFEVKDDNPDEMMKMIGLHADNSHGIKQILSDMMEKVKKVIKK